ncbi:hypothetical protein FBU30_005683 [Linnemannia zychae]|nr:hypothetical protein FBU30_005683 [Linnemannia zychae]
MTPTPTTNSTRPDSLVLRPMTNTDVKEVGHLFVTTFAREPLGEYMGVQPSEGESVAAAAVKDPVSFIIEDTSLPGPDRLVAFRTSCILTKESLAAKAAQIETEGHGDAIQAILNKLADIWTKNTTIFKTNPSAKVMKFIALGVDARYEGKGLAKELLNASMDKARDTGCDAVMVVASAFATQHLFSNRLGFEMMGRLKYCEFEWVNEKTGKLEKPFENLMKPEFIEIYEKKLV